MDADTPSGSLVRGLTILRALADADHGLSVADIAANQRIHRSTAFRLLQTLEAGGFVTRGDGGLWVLGSTLLQIGARALGQMRLRDVARPVMQRLAEETGESVQLTVRSGDELMTVDIVEGSKAVRVGLPLGYRAPLYCTATGKAILASLPDEELTSYLERTALVPQTPNTIVDPARFLQEIRRVRSLGYSVNDEESIAGVVFVGAPIFTTSARPVAALVLGAPAMRIHGEDIVRHGELVREAADRISQMMRGRRVADRPWMEPAM